MPSDTLIQQFGPIILLWYGAYYVLPQIVAVVQSIQQSRATVAEAPYEIVKTVLNERARKDELVAMELMGLRAGVDRANEAIEHLAKLFEEFIKSNTETKQ